MPRSHTQIRSDDVPWQRSRVHVPRVRPNARAVLTWINISVVDFAKNPVPQGETTSRIFFDSDDPGPLAKSTTLMPRRFEAMTFHGNGRVSMSLACVLIYGPYSHG
jgi:hypothetical protein